MYIASLVQFCSRILTRILTIEALLTRLIKMPWCQLNPILRDIITPAHTRVLLAIGHMNRRGRMSPPPMSRDTATANILSRYVQRHNITCLNPPHVII